MSKRLHNELNVPNDEPDAKKQKMEQKNDDDSTPPATDIVVFDEDIDDESEPSPPFNKIVDSILSSQLVSNRPEFIKYFCYIIAEMVVYSSNIKIDPETMLVNVSKKDWDKDKSWGDIEFPLSNLFQRNDSTFCSQEDSGNCVDIIIDLKHEYTLDTFDCHGPSWTWFSCPVTHAYLWVFAIGNTIIDNSNNTNSNNSRQAIEKMCKEKLYSKVTFENVLQLTNDTSVLDEQTRQRKRDEMIPVAFIKLEKSREKCQCKIPSYVRGRYIMIKLVSDQKIAREASNVDARYVGVRGYRMD